MRVSTDTIVEYKGVKYPAESKLLDRGIETLVWLVQLYGISMTRQGFQRLPSLVRELCSTPP